MNKVKKYSTAFSAGALMVNEAEAVISRINNPEGIFRGDEKLDYSTIPVNSESSKKRLGSELKKRLLSLGNPILLNEYISGSKDDKKLILFYSICKAYQLIADFMIEVVLRKWNQLDREIGNDDFKNYLYRKMDQDTDLENLTPETIKRRSGITIQMLKELGMIKDGKLQKKEFNPSILRRIAANGDEWFLEVLLLNESERNEIIQR